MTGSMRTFVTDRRTDGRTDGAEYIGPMGGSKKRSGEIKDDFSRQKERPKLGDKMANVGPDAEDILYWEACEHYSNKQTD